MTKENMLEVIIMYVETTPVIESVQCEPGETIELPERTRDRVLYFAEQVLQQEEKTSDRNTMKGPLVIKRAQEKFDEAKNISENTFLKYLSEAAKDPTSKIKTRGKRKGYYFGKAVQKMPSQEVSPEEEADKEQGLSTNQKEKLQQPCPMETDLRGSEINLPMKTQKIAQKLQELGKKYGCGSPPEYSIESRYQFSCKIADGSIRDIIIVIREADISVFYRPNPPGWFEGNDQIENALKEIQRLLENPKSYPSARGEFD